MVTPLTATLPLWVVIANKLFLNDVEKIIPCIAVGALLVVLGTIAISFAKVYFSGTEAYVTEPLFSAPRTDRL